MLPRMIGFEVIAPKLVALAWRRKRQRTSSRGTVRASRSVAATERWLAVLPFADGQSTLAPRAPHPAAAAANKNTAARAVTAPNDEAPGERLPRRSRFFNSAIEARTRRRGYRQPSASSLPIASLSSPSSSLPIVVPGGVPNGQPLAVGVVVVVVAGCGAGFTATPTPISPFIPPAA